MNTITLSSSVRRAVVVGIVGACALSVGITSAAADDLGVPTANIRYGDLNLSTVQGAKMLFERIVSASYSVCQSFGRDRNDNADPLGFQACRQKIIAEAVTKIGKPALYAVYNTKNGKPLLVPIVTAENQR